MKGILLAAYVESIASRKDKTMVLRLGTQELEPSKAGDIFNLNGQLISAYLCPKGIERDEIEIIDGIQSDEFGKSPSQRLRAVLYLMWKNNPEGFKDKNLHYVHYMEKIIEHFKQRLD